MVTVIPCMHATEVTDKVTGQRVRVTGVLVDEARGRRYVVLPMRGSVLGDFPSPRMIVDYIDLSASYSFEKACDCLQNLEEGFVYGMP